MSSDESRALFDMLRSNPPIQGETVLEMRAFLDSVTANLPAPPGVSIEPVDAGGVEAEWTTPENVEPNRTLVYFHGGGYSIASLSSHRSLAARLARDSEARVLNVAYRLAPEHPCPAAIEDAVAAYRYVVASGADPASIAIAGDSAGGGLTAACLIALRDAGDPLPAAGVCISPWMDLAFTGKSMQTNASSDPMVTRPMLQLMADAYLGGMDPKSPTASPLFADLRGLPPLLIQAGSAEVLLDDSIAFAERARAAGVDVELDVWDDMVHVWHSFLDMLPEAGAALEQIGAFLRARTP